MAAAKGNKYSSGRPKGSLGKKTIGFQETLKAHGYNVAEALLDIYTKAIQIFNEGRDEDRLGGLKIAGDMAKEIASYTMPKPKAIEIVTSNPLDNMSPAEKLEAMRQAVAMLEHEVKEVECSSEVEQQAVNLKVTGSIPVSPAND